MRCGSPPDFVHLQNVGQQRATVLALERYGLADSAHAVALTPVHLRLSEFMRSGTQREVRLGRNPPREVHLWVPRGEAAAWQPRDHRFVNNTRRLGAIGRAGRGWAAGLAPNA